MATATASDKRKGQDQSETRTSILDDTEVVDSISIPLRGRQVSQDVLDIREALEAMVADGSARSFKNVTKENREEYARKVRAAAKLKGKEPIEVGTRFDEAAGKLIWGPEDNLKKLSGKS
jgi:hypothetical protein